MSSTGRFALSSDAVREALDDPLVRGALAIQKRCRSPSAVRSEPELIARAGAAEREMAAERLDDLVHLGRREPQREQRLVQGLVLLEADRDARRSGPAPERVSRVHGADLGHRDDRLGRGWSESGRGAHQGDGEDRE